MVSGKIIAKQELLLAFAILVLVFLRLIYLTDASFINDEPMLLLNADAALLRGQVPILGLTGSQSIPYGPFATCFYGLCTLVSRDLSIALWAHALLSLLGVWFFSRAICLLRGRVVALWIAALVLSSPYLYYYGRNPWDITLFLFLGGCVFFVLVKMSINGERTSKSLLCFFALLTAAMVSLHLSSLFLVVTLWFFVLQLLLQKRNSTRELLGSLSLTIGVFGLALLPYLVGLFFFFREPHLVNSSSNAHHYIGDYRQAWWVFIKSLNYLSSWGFKYFLQPDEKFFYASFGKIFGFGYYHDFLGWPLKGIAIASLGKTIWSMYRGKSVWVESVLVFGYFSHCLILFFANYSIHPHYFLISWFCIFGLIALRLEFYAKIVLATGVIWNFCFLIFFLHFIHSNAGTRGYYYASTFAEQRRASTEICNLGKAIPKGEVLVNLREVTWFPHSFDLWMNRLPECAGKKWTRSENPPFDFAVTYSATSPMDSHLLVAPSLLPK